MALLARPLFQVSSGRKSLVPLGLGMIISANGIAQNTHIVCDGNYQQLATNEVSNWSPQSSFTGGKD
jgi:hypothetical protein